MTARPTVCLTFERLMRENLVTDRFWEWVERVRDHVDLVLFSPRFDAEDQVVSNGLWLHWERNAWLNRGGQRHPTKPLTLTLTGTRDLDPRWVMIDHLLNGDWTQPELTVARLVRRPKT